MSQFTAINLSQIPAPDVVEVIDFETLLRTIKDDFIAKSPDYADSLNLESEPLVKLMESVAYTVMTLRQRVNDASRSVMLAYATGADLDNLAALFAVERQLVAPGDETVIPPILPVFESDSRLRERVQLSLEGHSTADPIGSYVFWALSADPSVKDINVTSPNAAQVLVTVLSTIGEGNPSQELLNKVEATLGAEDVRPLTDQVFVQAASIIQYTLDATLILYAGPDTEIVRQTVFKAVQSYVTEHHRLGHDITLSGFYAALHQPGVQNVIIKHPVTDIICEPHQTAFCTEIVINSGGRDE